MPEIVLRYGSRYQVADGPLFLKDVPQYVEDNIAEILLTRETVDERGNVVPHFEDLTPVEKPVEVAKKGGTAKAEPHGKAEKKLPSEDILAGGGRLGSEQ